MHNSKPFFPGAAWMNLKFIYYKIIHWFNK